MKSVEKWQRLLQEGPEAVAIEADRRCRHCNRVKPWEVMPHQFDPDRLFAYPLPCGCDGEKEAARKEKQKEADDMERMREYAIVCALNNAGLTGRLKECTFDTFRRRKDWPNAFDLSIKARNYWNAIYGNQFGHKPWLVMCGAYGTGKTHLAAAIVREAVLSGWKNVYFRSWTEYLTNLQASWDRERGEPRTNDLIDELKKGSLVVIDDIDKRESRSGWAPGELYAALNYRYNKLLPTVLTFNAKPTQPDPQARGRMLLERYMGRALIDRIIESAWTVMEFDGPSYRSGVKW